MIGPVVVFLKCKYEMLLCFNELCKFKIGLTSITIKLLQLVGIFLFLREKSVLLPCRCVTVTLVFFKLDSH